MDASSPRASTSIAQTSGRTRLTTSATVGAVAQQVSCVYAIRFREFATPWFDYLIVSQEEMQELAADSDWQVRRLIEDDSPLYCVVLEKD